MMKIVSFFVVFTCFADPLTMKELEAKVADQENAMNEKVEQLTQRVGHVLPLASMLEESDNKPFDSNLDDASTEQASNDLATQKQNIDALSKRMQDELKKIDQHEMETNKIITGSLLQTKSLPDLEADTIQTKADTKALAELQARMKEMRHTLGAKVEELEKASVTPPRAGVALPSDVTPSSLVQESSKGAPGLMDINDVVAEEKNEGDKMNRVAQDMLEAREQMANSLKKLDALSKVDHRIPVKQEDARRTGVDADGSLAQLRAENHK